MRLIVPLTAAALLAACASTPKPAPITPVEPVVERPRSGDLTGMTAGELGARFGSPRLTVREGSGTKLQFTKANCVLDAYLYPPAGGSGVARVTHVDTRTREGRGADQAGCIAALEAR